MLNTSQFYFDTDIKTLSAEASELPDNGWSLGNFKVKSTHTQKEIEFKFSHAMMDESNEDIMGWVFLPVVSCNVRRLIIWND